MISSLFSHDYFSMSKCNIYMQLNPLHIIQGTLFYMQSIFFCSSYIIDFCLYTQTSPIYIQEQWKLFSIKTNIFHFSKPCKWPIHVWHNTFQSWINKKYTLGFIIYFYENNFRLPQSIKFNFKYWPIYLRKKIPLFVVKVWIISIRSVLL